MLLALLILVAINLVAVLALLLRQPAAVSSDPQISLHLNEIANHLNRIEATTEARLTAVDSHLRDTSATVGTELAQFRRDADAQAHTHRDSASRSAADLREEISRTILGLGNTISSGMNDFRTHSTESLAGHRADVSASAEALRSALKQDLEAIGGRLNGFIAETNRHQADSREALHTRLASLGEAQTAHQDRLRATVEERLGKLNADNVAKLEEMRATVDEKLHATLQSRLTESFGQVTTHLGEVQKGLGEMKQLATGVGDLKKVLSNVKSRGVVGEFQLGLQLEQMFSPEQYIKNARIKKNSLESVEYALKFPAGESGYTLLPIDAKFPKEDWERLEHAYDHGSAEEIAAAGKAFERSIRAEGKRISDKYIDPPTTMPHAIMFLPTENLYAEVVRRPGLQSEIQSNCRVTIAGPSTFMAILTSFQMGFHTLAIEKKGSEVRSVLAKAKDEFGRFGGLMDKVERQVGTVQNTLKEISGKTTTINRALRDVTLPDGTTAIPPAAASNLLAFEEAGGVAPLLAASGESDS